MKKACLYTDSAYAGNRIFNLDDPRLNRDNCLYPFFLLKQILITHDIELNTQDITKPEEALFTLFNEMPSRDPVGKSYAMLFETELIRPENWNIFRHSLFQKIFTWNDLFAGQKNYVKFNFPNDLTVHFQPGDERAHFCTLIAGNKKNSHPLELYSKRLETIHWFQDHHPEEFQYFGMGWEVKSFPTDKIWGKVLKRFKIPNNPGPCFRGSVREKISTLKQFRFAICYENARDISGYITEKIFDCFIAGCIPIYWGADNISTHVPAECFIDRRKFNSHSELVSFLHSLTPSEVSGYQTRIKNFLESESAFTFSNNFFAQTISETILKDLSNGQKN